MAHYVDLDISLEDLKLQYLSKSRVPEVGFGLFGPQKTVLCKSYKILYEPIQTFEVRNDDIWMISFPKSGSTWLRELVWLVQNDCNFQSAESPISFRFPWLEKSMVPIGGRQMDGIKSVENIANLPTTAPRFIKTHLTWDLLPKEIQTGAKQPKIIYIARNPKDVCVSFFHNLRGFNGYIGTIDDFVEFFINGQVPYGPYWTHINEFWCRRNADNFLFLTYESMKEDLHKVILQVGNFLGKSISAKNITQLIEHLCFESMKKNKWVNKEDVLVQLAGFHEVEKTESFIRKGIVNGWKDELCKESVDKLDNWVQNNKIDGIWNL